MATGREVCGGLDGAKIESVGHYCRVDVRDGQSRAEGVLEVDRYVRDIVLLAGSIED